MSAYPLCDIWGCPNKATVRQAFSRVWGGFVMWLCYHHARAGKGSE